MAPKSFLFVNKNQHSESLSNSRKDRTARIQIQQHAGNNANRKLKRRTIVKAEYLDSEQQALQRKGGIKGGRTGTLVRLAPRERHIHLISPRPRAPISSVPNYLTLLTPREQQVLHHYTSTWMPTFAGHGTTTGFTILSSKDMAFSSFIIQSALQTDNTFSLYAFLTMAAQRMHLTNSLPREDSSPEYFSVKSVQALRSMAFRPFSEQLVLALANLVLGEAYIRREGRTKTPAVSIYRAMQRDLIIKAGGLHVLSPPNAQIAVAYDFYTSQGTLTLPYYDVYQNPALLGIDVGTLSDCWSDRHDYIRNRLDSLDLSLRVLLESSHDLAEVITSIGRLDSYAIKGLAAEIWANVPRKLALNAATLQKLGSLEATSCVEDVDLEAADALWMHIRQQIYLVWVWHSALGLSMSIASPHTCGVIATSLVEPTCVTRAHSQLWQQLDQVQYQLEHSGWKVRIKVVMWMCAVCSLTASKETEKQAYLRRCQSSAVSLEIGSEEEFRVTLAAMLPLDHLLPGQDAVGWLWGKVMQTRRTVLSMRNMPVQREEWLGRAIIQECSKEESPTP